MMPVSHPQRGSSLRSSPQPPTCLITGLPDPQVPRLRSLQHQLQVPQGTLSSSFPRALGLRQLPPTIPLASAGVL